MSFIPEPFTLDIIKVDIEIASNIEIPNDSALLVEHIRNKDDFLNMFLSLDHLFI